MGCVTQLRWKGQKFDQAMGPIEEQEGTRLCLSARMYAYFADVAKLNLLTT
jgi:hypothetical protein